MRKIRRVKTNQGQQIDFPGEPLSSPIARPYFDQDQCGSETWADTGRMSHFFAAQKNRKSRDDGNGTMIELPYEDRADAARQLAKVLARYAKDNPLVLAIPRGGVPLGRVVADVLGGELDVVLVRKLGAPDNPEFAIGAIDEQGRITLTDAFAMLDIDQAYLRQEADRQLALIRARRARYSLGMPSRPFAGRTVIVVDDGLATGATMTAALDAVRAQGPARLVCALPVAARDSLATVSKHADEVVCLATPEPFIAVGRFYRDFSGVGEDEVIELLARPGKQGMEF